MDKTEIKIINNWRDDLIWCPSQCYLDFKLGNRFFTLYLRWRGDDPWTITLIECPDDGFDMHTDFDWVYLKSSFKQDDDLSKIKESAIGQAKEWFKNNS